MTPPRKSIHRCCQRVLLLRRRQQQRMMHSVTTCYTRPFSTNATTNNNMPLRRSRIKYEKYSNPQMGTQLPTSSLIEEPFEYSGDTIAEYSEKATLSPWVPVPDSVARKIFDRAEVSPDDVHVELGSGDGRVNFFAIEYGAKKSIGIDVDEDIVKLATERLNKIHPKPPIEFIIEDLMDPNNPVWDKIQEATILTMYFAKDGLEKIRPSIENALRGKRCRIFTCGYPMPGWESHMIETVLDMPIHFYDWGNPDIEDLLYSDPDSILDQLPSSDFSQPKQMDKFLERKNSTFKHDPLPGFSTEDTIDYSWDDFDDDEIDDDDDDDDDDTRTDTAGPSKTTR